VAAYAEETGGHGLPLDHFIEWLAEWGREFRRRQRGLLLLTAHRAKGLEFDHVAVLDGGWSRSDRSEDRDAPRRLFYVAMTRARRTLTLARLEGANPYLDGLESNAACVARDAAPRAVPHGLDRQYVRLTPGDVDLDFAGREGAQHRIHRAIAALSTGDELALVADGARRELRDRRGTAVGKLAAAFQEPAGMVCIGARVAAIVARWREDSAPEYRGRVRSERWEVVVPELVFAPR
jgi:ATP-dependent DNA helicase RecQ